MRKKNKMWTKDEIKQLVNIWETSTLEEVAGGVNRKKSQVSAMARKLRQAGLKLSHKRKNNTLNHMIAEVVAELKAKKK